MCLNEHREFILYVCCFNICVILTKLMMENNYPSGHDVLYHKDRRRLHEL